MFLPIVHKGSLIFASSLTFALSRIFCNSHSKRCEGMSPCGFVLHLSDGRWCWQPFCISVDCSSVFHGNMSFQVLCPCLKSCCMGFLFLSFMGSLYFLILSSYQMSGCKYFLPVHRLPFHFVHCFLRCAEAWSLILPLSASACVVCAFDIISKG